MKKILATITIPFYFISAINSIKGATNNLSKLIKNCVFENKKNNPEEEEKRQTFLNPIAPATLPQNTSFISNILFSGKRQTFRDPIRGSLSMSVKNAFFNTSPFPFQIPGQKTHLDQVIESGLLKIKAKQNIKENSIPSEENINYIPKKIFNIEKYEIEEDHPSDLNNTCNKKEEETEEIVDNKKKKGEKTY